MVDWFKLKGNSETVMSQSGFDSACSSRAVNVIYRYFYASHYILKYLIIIVCPHASLCTWVHSCKCYNAHVEMRGQLVGLGFLPLSWGLWGLNLCHVTWMKASHH